MLPPYRYAACPAKISLSRSTHCPWYDGATLIDHLESVPLEEEAEQKRPFCMPVQWVNRANLDFRGFAGSVVSGEVHPGEAVRSCRWVERPASPAS